MGFGCSVKIISPVRVFSSLKLGNIVTAGHRHEQPKFGSVTCKDLLVRLKLSIQYDLTTFLLIFFSDNSSDPIRLVFAA